MSRAFYFSREGKEGLINSSGCTILEPVFDDIGLFHDGHASFTNHGLVGLLNDEGKVVVSNLYDSLLVEGELSLGVPVKKNGKWGYVDLCGNMKIAMRFEEALPFHDGLAPTTVNGVSWEYISSDGKVNFVDQMGEPLPFACGRKRLTIKKNLDFSRNGLYGYLNKQGEVVVEPIFAEASRLFCDNRASVRSLNGHYGVIDIVGEYIVDPVYTWIGNYHCGLAAARVGEDSWKILDTNGDVLWEFKAHNASGPRSGFIKCEFEHDLCGLFSVRGDEVIPPQYFNIESWDNSGIATVQNQDGKYGAFSLISKKEIIPCVHENFFLFDGELALIHSKNKTYVDRNGKTVFTFGN